MAREYKSLITNLIALALTGIGYVIPVYGPFITTAGYFALSGAITNWIAIYMLFERVPFLYGSGTIPLHFQEFKSGIKQLIMNQFFTEQSLKAFFGKEKKEEALNSSLEHLIESIDFNYIFHQLALTILDSKFGTALALFGGEKALQPLKEPLIKKLHDLIQEVLHSEQFKQRFLQESLSTEVHQKIEQRVDERLAELSPSMVKVLIQDMIRRHLGWLTVWGGVFGGLIGITLEIAKLVAPHYT